MKKLLLISILFCSSSFAYEDEQKVAACFIYHVVNDNLVYAHEISKLAQDQNLLKAYARPKFEELGRQAKSGDTKSVQTYMMYARGQCRSINARF